MKDCFELMQEFRKWKIPTTDKNRRFRLIIENLHIYQTQTDERTFLKDRKNLKYISNSDRISYEEEKAHS